MEEDKLRVHDNPRAPVSRHTGQDMGWSRRGIQDQRRPGLASRMNKNSWERGPRFWGYDMVCQQLVGPHAHTHSLEWGFEVRQARPSRRGVHRAAVIGGVLILGEVARPILCTKVVHGQDTLVGEGG